MKTSSDLYRELPGIDELLRDPEGWCEREAKRVLAELRGTSAGVGE